MSEYVNTVSVARLGRSIKSTEKFSGHLKGNLADDDQSRLHKGYNRLILRHLIIQYNDENALSYTISLALYAARNFYTMHRELAGGKGFADIVFISRIEISWINRHLW
ncbi:MAG: hypothetical protein ACLTZM_27045 [Ruminococcus sp.]